MSEAGVAPFHAGLTPERVIDEALDLTRASHLWGWSIRDLARRLDVAPSVVYHHVGGKDMLARHVVERAFADLEVPSRDLAWQEWFRELTGEIYPRAIAHPGAAKWLLMHGPTFPTVLPILDAGIRMLQAVGFADDAGFAYAAVLNNAILTVSMGDERLVHEDDGPRDHATLMADFRVAGAGSPGVAVLTTQFLDPFVADVDTAARERRRYYDFVVETTLAGLAARLGTHAGR